MATHTNIGRDKRQAERIPIALPVQVANRSGRTRDLSLHGVYFVTDGPFDPSGKLGFSVDLRYVNPDGVLRLVCEGTVLRVERRDDKTGVAVGIDSHRLEVAECTKPGVAVSIGSHRLPLLEYME